MGAAAGVLLLLSAAAAACGGPPGPCFLQGTPRWAPAGRLREDVCRRAGGVRPAKAAWQCAILDDERAAKTPLVIPQSKLWVEKFIVGLNLCPFAREPFKKDTIRYAISDAKDGDELINDCFRECAVLLDSDPDEVSTTLLLAPAFAAGLQAWGDVGYWMEDYLEEEDEPLFDGRIGVAFFHPNWNFEELTEKDPTHFERRAPFPTVSLLRKDDIGDIVKEFLAKDIVISEKVHLDNSRILEEKGFEALSTLLTRIRGAGKPARAASKKQSKADQTPGTSS